MCNFKFVYVLFDFFVLSKVILGDSFIFFNNFSFINTNKYHKCVLNFKNLENLENFNNLSNNIQILTKRQPLKSFFKETDDSTYFLHTLKEGEKDSKNNKKEEQIIKKKYNFGEKAIVKREPIKNVKSRFKLQKFPKRQGIEKNERYKFVKNLKVGGGFLRGRKLCIPPVYVRPVMSKVKSSLFNFFQSVSIFSIDKNTKVLDLFCGTGSLGIEALSYGSSSCTFVDISLKCLKAVNFNVEKCNLRDKSRIIRADALELINSPYLYNVNEKFDLVFVCPPYEEVIYSSLLEDLEKCNLLNENALVVVEYPMEIDFLPFKINENLFGVKNKRYGRTVVAVYIYKPSENRQKLMEKGCKSFFSCRGGNKSFVRRKLREFLAKFGFSSGTKSIFNSSDSTNVEEQEVLVY